MPFPCQKKPEEKVSKKQQDLSGQRLKMDAVEKFAKGLRGFQASLVFFEGWFPLVTCTGKWNHWVKQDHRPNEEFDHGYGCLTR